MTRAAIYARISSDRDDERLGVERQVDDCRRLCSDRGWDVIEPPYVDNDVSAADPRKRRPDHERLMTDIKSGRVDAVVVWDVDRLYRQPRELEPFVEACEGAGLRTLGSVGGDIDLNDEAALLMLRMKVNMGAFEIAKMRKRIRRKKLELAERGSYHGGGTRPFGFERDGVTVRESEAELIREAAQRVLSGGSLYSIRQNWTERGVPTVTGTRWSVVSIKRTLTRPRTAGLRQHQGAILGEAAWLPILDRPTWEQVCAVLTDLSRRQPPPSRSYPLRGVLHCAECGRSLSAMPRRDRRLYGCRKDGGGCGHVFVNADLVEAHVFGILLPLADQPGLRAVIAGEEGEEQAEAQRLVTENAADERMLSRLDDDYADEAIPRSTYLRQSQRLRSRVDDRHARLAAMRGRSALDRLGGHVAERWPEMTAEDRRSIVLSLVSGIDLRRSAVLGGAKFDMSRLAFRWRFDALARIADRIPESEWVPESGPAWDEFGNEYELTILGPTSE